MSMQCLQSFGHFTLLDLNEQRFVFLDVKKTAPPCGQLASFIFAHNFQLFIYSFMFPAHSSSRQHKRVKNNLSTKKSHGSKNCHLLHKVSTCSQASTNKIKHHKINGTVQECQRRNYTKQEVPAATSLLINSNNQYFNCSQRRFNYSKESTLK